MAVPAHRLRVHPALRPPVPGQRLVGPVAPLAAVAAQVYQPVPPRQPLGQAVRNVPAQLPQLALRNVPARPQRPVPQRLLAVKRSERRATQQQAAVLRERRSRMIADVRWGGPHLGAMAQPCRAQHRAAAR